MLVFGDRLKKNMVIELSREGMEIMRRLLVEDKDSQYNAKKEKFRIRLLEYIDILQGQYGEIKKNASNN